MTIETTETPQSLLFKATILCESLPFLKKFSGETFVVKYGGSAMGSGDILKSFAQDVVLLKQVGINPIVVHGGGPQISQMLDRLKIRSEFIDGLRVTDAAAVEIVEMVLSGLINKQIVMAINDAGGTALGMSGKDGNLIQARKLRRTQKDQTSNIEKILDLGFVGEPEYINPEILSDLEETMIIPVISPVGRGANGETYNINADTVAGSIAGAIKASKLIMLTDVDGVLDIEGKLISSLSLDDVEELLFKKVITGGMIPKVETCVKAIKNGVTSSHILNGNTQHVTLIETFTERGVGTMIYSNF